MPPRLSLEIDVRRRSRAHGYNKDLLSKLRSLERAGRIQIERIEKNYIGPNPINPGTAIFGGGLDQGLAFTPRPWRRFFGRAVTQYHAVPRPSADYPVG